MSEKKSLRERILADTDALRDGYVRMCDEMIYEHVAALPEFIAAQTVLAYYSTGREVSSRRIIDAVLARGCVLCLPESLPGGVMRARRIADLSELVQGRFGIPAPPESAEIVPPDALDFVLVPGVTFDREGYRLGRGGGYYDRYLPQVRAFTAGLTRDALTVSRVPRDGYDYPVRCVVTETGVYRYV